MSQSPLDKALVSRGMVPTRSEAENYIRLRHITVNGKVVTDPATLVDDASTTIGLVTHKRYVSRAGMKLASVAEALNLNFSKKIVLDVGSSTGGFTDYALQHGAQKVLAVDIGTQQLHPKLRANQSVEVYEKTDIRSFVTRNHIDLVLIDVSFTSLRDILPHIAMKLTSPSTTIIAMVKPQFETHNASAKHKGVIKNDRLRRDILKDFEQWLKPRFIVINKVDSAVPGAAGNRERFYLLRPIAT